jgi:hypothetical protein
MKLKNNGTRRCEQTWRLQELYIMKHFCTSSMKFMAPILTTILEKDKYLISFPHHALSHNVNWPW